MEWRSGWKWMGHYVYPGTHARPVKAGSLQASVALHQNKCLMPAVNSLMSVLPGRVSPCGTGPFQRAALSLSKRVAEIESDLAQRRFMLVGPGNRLVADTLEADWNDKLRALARAREEWERARQADERLLGEAVRERLIAMTADFKRLWVDPGTPNRERKRMLDHIIEDATLVKLPAEGTTKVHIRCVNQDNGCTVVRLKLDALYVPDDI